MECLALFLSKLPFQKGLLLNSAIVCLIAMNKCNIELTRTC